MDSKFDPKNPKSLLFRSKMWVQSIQKVDKVDPKYASHELKIWILRIQIVDQNVDPVIQYMEPLDPKCESYRSQGSIIWIPWI